ncbi:MAG: hypothetical protein IMZ62_14075, partial [Chloroflexi bacterium]|nr:hypothetical protein [Chloroflexota bacterium]
MKHFLDISDHSPEELQELLDLAIHLKKEHFATGNPPLFKGKVLGMIFKKPSLHIKEVRGKGLLIGVELNEKAGGARRFCEALQNKGILA